MKGPTEPARGRGPQSRPVRRMAGWLGPLLVIAVVAVLAILARPAFTQAIDEQLAAR